MSSRRGNHEGTITKTRSGTYRAQISINRKRYSKSFKTKTAAQRWLRSKGQEAESGLANFSDVALGEYLTKWFNLYRSTLQPTTAQSYKQYIDKYLIPHIGKITLRKLTPIKVDQFYTFLLVSKGKSPTTIKHIHRVLHRALEYGVEKRILPYNPAHRANLPKIEKKERPIWTPDESRKFLEAAKFTPYEMVFYLAIKTGMRQSELFALRWSDINWEQHTIRVSRQLAKKRGDKGSKMLKTTAGYRTIPLGKKTMEKLKIHREQVEIKSKSSPETWQKNNLLLPSQAGTPYNQGNIRKMMVAVIEKENLRYIRFHDLRHTAASIMLNSGIPIVEVSRLLGHKSISTTLDTYTHFIPSMHTEKADKIDAILNI